MLDFFTDLISLGNTAVWNYVPIALLVILGVYFTIRFRFVQFRFIKEMFKVLGREVSEDKKGVSSFQAFTISTASRVGTGNLSGVALAISVGGPGAVFWMWVIALIGVQPRLLKVHLPKFIG